MSSTRFGQPCPCGCGVLVDDGGVPLVPPAPLLPDLPVVVPGVKWAPPPVIITPVFTPTQPVIRFSA